MGNKQSSEEGKDRSLTTSSKLSKSQKKSRAKTNAKGTDTKTANDTNNKQEAPQTVNTTPNQQKTIQSSENDITKPEQPKTQQQNGTQSASQPPSQASTTYAQSPNTSLNISRRPAELQSSLAQLGLTNSNPDTDDVQTDSTPVSRAKIDFQYVSNQKRSAEASKAKFTNLHFIPFWLSSAKYTAHHPGTPYLPLPGKLGQIPYHLGWALMRFTLFFSHFAFFFWIAQVSKKKSNFKGSHCWV